MEQAAKDAPAKPGAVEETLHRVNRTIDNVDRIVGDRNNVSSALAIAPQAPQPVAPWYVWACVIAAWLATTSAAVALQATRNADQRMTDLRIDMRAQETQAAIMDRWTAQEVTAIRSYITTGKLAPMNPPPVEKKEQSK